jgi:hypothetical protein
MPNRSLQGCSDTPRKGFSRSSTWLEARVSHDGDECLIWPFSKNDQGYGQLKYRGHSTKAHRVMCRLVHGDPPTPKHQAAHSCNNGHLGCVHPKHVSWKTPSQNAQDRVRAGNQRKYGEIRAKLTEDQVRQIWQMKGSETITKLGEMFGVSFSTISSIYCGRVWRHVQVNNNAQ